MKSPVVSVIMATYNHAPYVAQAIESVLGQRGVDFEFLIADDGSTDATVQVVKSIKDSRISFFHNQANRGACIVTNELIGRASGEFIAIINSDDYWSIPDKLNFQINIMQNNPSLGASFGQVRFVNRRGFDVKKSALYFGTVFNQQNRSQAEWLRYFFEFGNCLCHPTMLIRRRCYEELGGYSNTYRQLPDFDMWVRLLKRYPIHISDQEMISFRVLPGENVSSPGIANSVRTINEHYLIAESFFDDVDAEMLKNGFIDLLKCKDIPSNVHLDIEKALLFFASNSVFGDVYKMIGILKLSRLLSSKSHCAVLEGDYNIDAHWFQDRMAEIDVLRPKFIALLGQQKRNLKSMIARFTGFF